MSPTCPALQPFRTLVLSLGDSTLLGSLNLGLPVVSHSPLLPWSGPGPVQGRLSGGVSGKGTYCCLLQCLPTNLLTSVLSLPGKPEVSSANGFPGSLAHRLEPNFSANFS